MLVEKCVQRTPQGFRVVPPILRQQPFPYQRRDFRIAELNSQATQARLLALAIKAHAMGCGRVAKLAVWHRSHHLLRFLSISQRVPERNRQRLRAAHVGSSLSFDQAAAAIAASLD